MHRPTSPLWTPTQSQINDTIVAKFLTRCAEKYNFPKEFDALYDWSVTDTGNFWSEVWDYCGIVGEKGTIAIKESSIFQENRFFPDASLNYAENILNVQHDPEAPAITFWCQDDIKSTLTHGALRAQVSQLAQYLRDKGLQPGDRVACVMPNTPDTIVFMLAAASIGAIFSSCSPDFGANSILDRITQIMPKILMVTDGQLYKRAFHDCSETIKMLIKGLPSVEQVIFVPFPGTRPEAPKPLQAPSIITLSEIFKCYSPKDITFTRLPFNHPLYILYSSGTTGKPKCIVHGAGGTLIQHKKEHQLHCDIKPGDKLFYVTTVAWMMWHWQVSALASGAEIMLYDGFPFGPKDILFRYVAAEKITHMGVSAKYIDACQKFNLTPGASSDGDGTHCDGVLDLSSLRMIMSTGSPLPPTGFTYVYQNIKSDLCLASISGGTDIISCFALGNPMGAVYPGQLQTRGLGMAVAVYDDEGKPCRGQKGELVCTKPFPSQPIYFWNDPDNQQYIASYFTAYNNIWHHGDFVELTAENGMIFYGRSDATLNPNGVRIGTAEIYRQVEKIPAIIDAAAVGHKWKGDTRIILFVTLQEGHILCNDLKRDIKEIIRSNTSPRHVPAEIFQVSGLPRTTNGKLSEIAITRAIHHEAINNRHALSNPETLDEIMTVFDAA